MTFVQGASAHAGPYQLLVRDQAAMAKLYCGIDLCEVLLLGSACTIVLLMYLQSRCRKHKRGTGTFWALDTRDIISLMRALASAGL